MKSRIAQLILFVSTLLTVLNPAFSGEICPNLDTLNINDDNEKFRELMARSVFQVVVTSKEFPDKPIGTATLISRDGYLLSAAHIFELDDKRILKGLEKNTLSLSLRRSLNGVKLKDYKGRLLPKLTKKYDLSVIKLINWDYDKNIKPIGIDVKSEPHLNRVKLMGYVAGDVEASVSEAGNIKKKLNRKGYLRVSNLGAYQGYSGSLLINKNKMAVAVLSGKSKQNASDNTTWVDIGDHDNGILNAVPLNAVIKDFVSMDIEEDKNFINDIKKSEAISADRIKLFIRNNRMAAMIFTLRILNNDEEIQITDNNFFKFYMLANCIMPVPVLSELFAKLMSKSSTAGRKMVLNNKVAKLALDTAKLKYSKYKATGKIEFRKEALAQQKLANVALNNNAFIRSAAIKLSRNDHQGLVTDWKALNDEVNQAFKDVKFRNKPRIEYFGIHNPKAMTFGHPSSPNLKGYIGEYRVVPNSPKFGGYRQPATNTSSVKKEESFYSPRFSTPARAWKNGL